MDKACGDAVTGDMGSRSGILSIEQAGVEIAESEEEARLNPRFGQERLWERPAEVWAYYVVQLNTLPATAEHFGVCVGSLRKFIRTQKWPTRGRTEAQGLRRKSEDMKNRHIIAKAVQMRREGATLNEIALACGRTVSSVWRILQRHNR